MKKILALCLALAAVVMGVLSAHRFWQEQNAGSEYDALRKNVEAETLPETEADHTAGSFETVLPEVIAASEFEAASAVSGEVPESSSSGEAPESSSSGEAPESTAPPSEKRPVTSPAATPDPASLPEEVRSIDWKKLKETCPDAYAWIRIDGTEIDYPVVQHPTDNTFYLTHSADKKEALAGAIFTENFNKKDFSDPVTVIYGHNMKNGSMFRGLHQYKDPVFFQEHQNIKIILPDKLLDVKVFAAYTTDNRHQLFGYDFSDPDEFQAYVQEILLKKEIGTITDPTVKIAADDHIVTLSTCNGNSEQRYVLQGVIEKQ